MSKVQKSHKGFVIHATAFPLREPEGRFTVHVNITKDEVNFSDDALFESGQVFPTENQALEAGIQIGRQKIDAGFQPGNGFLNLDEVATTNNLP